MLSKKIIKIILGGACFLMAACEPNHSLMEENIIGERLNTVSFTSDVENNQRVNLFDNTTRRIHSFDLDNNFGLESFSVLKPEDTHYIVASDDTSFVADLSRSQLSIYRYNGSQDRDIVNFMGEPISSAYNSSTGHLAVYDNLNSVSLLKINTEGVVDTVWVGGPIINDGGSILSGDITEGGDLVLSLTDDTLAIVDIDESLNQEKWIYRIDSAIAHDDVKWIAGVSGDLILYQTERDLVLYDYVNSLVVDQKNFPSEFKTLAYGKTVDPHVIYESENFLSLDEFKIAYVEGLEIKLKELVNHTGSDGFHQSRLDLDADQWSYINADKYTSTGYTRGVGHYEKLPRMSEINRKFLVYRFSDMLATANMDLPDLAKLKRAKSYVFALFPSELGYAEKINIHLETREEMRNFNIPYINGDLMKVKEGI